MRTTVLIAVLSAGCVGELDEPTSITEQHAGICPPETCRNSDIVARNGIWEGNLNGLKDRYGVSLVSRSVGSYKYAQIWSADDVAYDLRVVNGKISGRKGTQRISGQGLVGATFQFQKNGAVLYTVVIDAVLTNTIRVPAGTSETIETYRLSWSRPDGTRTASCPAGAGLGVDETLVWEGDRIDPPSLTMSDNAHIDPSWINFACGNSVGAKLRMTRKTYSNQPTKDWAVRQAALKMLTADYCGTGQNFTSVGTAIAWKDDDGVVTDYVLSNPQANVIPAIEARWTPGGASCLNTPRLQSSGQDPYVAQKIHNVCLPLECVEDAPANPPNVLGDGSRIVSAYPGLTLSP